MSGALFQAAVDRALGAVGRSFGKPYAVYRIIQTSSGDFPNGWSQRTTNAPLLRNRVSSRNIESNLLSERTLWFELAGDLSPFLLGDVFVSADQTYYPGVGYGAGATTIAGTTEIDGLALAWHAPAQPPLGARIDRRVGIYRPSLAPTTMPDGSKRWNTTREQDTPLILNAGTYSFGAAAGKASWVPCGFGSNDRQFKDGPFAPDKIGAIPSARYFAYLPPLPGYTPVEGDALITEDDTRHVVLATYGQSVGVVGSQLMTERLISGTS